MKASDEGGVVWHTQGSGKSITMIYIATKLRREEYGFNNPTILILTDRVDLDDQISRTFERCGFENPNQAKSVSHLKSTLKNDYGQTVMSTIFKFQEVDAEGKVVAKELEDIEVLSEKKNFYVMVDEAHRSQYGLMAAFMRRAIPHAKFVAFTGTPLDQEAKSTLGNFYGGNYIDVYHIKQSVEDGATLPILYEDGLPELYVAKDLLNQQFENTFGNESNEKKSVLKKSATSIAKIMTAKKRIKKVAEHMVEHYEQKTFPDGLKAMVVCYNRESAITYKKVLDEMKAEGVHTFNSRVVMSFSPKKDPKEYYELATPEKEIKQAVENFKLPFGDESNLSKSGQLQFNNDAFLIVSDMLLTGFDAPIIQVMYLDKILKEHNLLQAIARVNRTRIGKIAGFLVDYCGITENLVEALKIFGGDLEPDDVMQNTAAEITRLERRHQQLVAFFSTISIDRKAQRKTFIDQALHVLELEDKRDEFKSLLKKFNASMSIVLPDPHALAFVYDFYLYNEIKVCAGNMFQDSSMKVTQEENQKLQAMLNEHLHATGIRSLLEGPVSISILKSFRKSWTNKPV